MTGFSRASGQVGGANVTWELRSVNGKSVELRLRLPPGLDRLEPAIRKAVQQKFARGNIQASLNLTRQTTVAALPIVNEEFLKQAAALAARLQHEFNAAPATADGLLALRGVLEVAEPVETEEERTASDKAVLAVLDDALAGLASARSDEGAALARVILGQVEQIEILTRRAEADPSREVSAIRQRLAEQVGLLLQTGNALDEQRLYLEAALLATKADIREELDRLHTHIAAARELVGQGGPVGRKLDFLAQEFNRESNTLCSKSNAASLTAIGLELKVVVDRFREQIQNLE